MEPNYLKMKKEIKVHLINTGCTFSAEEEPVVLRQITVDAMLDTVLEFMIGAGYASPTKSF